MLGVKERRRVARVHGALRRWFEDRGLDLEPVWAPLSDDLEQQNRHLESLQCWVMAYERYGDREELERRGFRFPPIEPDFDPDTDWLRFERWITGDALGWSYVDEFGPVPEIEAVAEQELLGEIERVIENLERRDVVVELKEGIPAPLVYAYLRSVVEEEQFEYLAPNGIFVLDGCDGYCPGCFQRPWCEVGLEPNWPEDSLLGLGEERIAESC